MNPPTMNFTREVSCRGGQLGSTSCTGSEERRIGAGKACAAGRAGAKSSKGRPDACWARASLLGPAQLTHEPSGARWVPPQNSHVQLGPVEAMASLPASLIRLRCEVSPGMYHGSFFVSCAAPQLGQ
ncbi:MAG: hypothetical protein NUV84_05190 [Candidatus Uhrbacteria bacterium]|nr:hypothetical protein [Candidatus Uhrbacteria bacterium]